MRLASTLVVLPLLWSAGCIGLTPMPDGPVSFGYTSAGVLLDGIALADRGTGFERARPGESTRFGTPQLIGALERAAADVASAYPGSAPLRVGDLSAPDGGFHPRHHSHRSGRDADVLFYITDASGRSEHGRGWLAFDRFGVARETRTPSGPGSGQLFFFDDARNWHFVRSLLTDPHADIVWIFCSRGIKARLLAYGAAHETDPNVLFRAAWVLHQPHHAAPHDDHFHVRVACTADERAGGCRDRGPVWPWIQKDVEKPADPPGEPLDDAALVWALLSDDGSTSPRSPALARQAKVEQPDDGDTATP